MKKKSPAVLLLFALVLLTAACGTASADEQSGGVATLENTSSEDEDDATIDDDGGGDDGGGGAATAADDESQLLAFAACMRENGVDMADPTVDADGNLQLGRPGNLDPADRGSIEDTQAAREACAEYLDGVDLGFQERDQTELQDQILEFTTCMRENGYEDMPDIDFGRGGAPGAAGGGLADVDQDDPDYQAAFEVCGDVLAGFGPGGAGGPGAGGFGGGDRPGGGTGGGAAAPGQGG